jgi:hypothetical protein
MGLPPGMSVGMNPALFVIDVVAVPCTSWPPSICGLTALGGRAILRAVVGRKESTAMPLTVIAKLKAKDVSEEQLYEELRNLVGPTRAEEGCINYDLHRSVEDPGTFMFYENWESRSL